MGWVFCCSSTCIVSNFRKYNYSFHAPRTCQVIFLGNSVQVPEDSVKKTENTPIIRIKYVLKPYPIHDINGLYGIRIRQGEVVLYPVFSFCINTYNRTHLRIWPTLNMSILCMRACLRVCVHHGGQKCPSLLREQGLPAHVYN